jgi:hypothetical protein
VLVGAPSRATVVADGHATRTAQQAIARHIVNLDALADPEGVILVIDAQRSPYVKRYADVEDFLARETGSGAAHKRPRAQTVTLTGVGSYALGSVRSLICETNERLGGEGELARLLGLGVNRCIAESD